MIKRDYGVRRWEEEEILNIFIPARNVNAR
jgi:hypothetical protein